MPTIELPPHDAPPVANACRILSYNTNLLPSLVGLYNTERYADERMGEFCSRIVNNFDVLLLQEAYASTTLPFTLQELACNQRRLIKALCEPKGPTPAHYPYHVRPKQPSLISMVKHTCITDTGLLILSRYPIEDGGSLVFRAHRRGAQWAPKGAVYAKIRVGSSAQWEGSSQEGRGCILVVNVHMASSTASENASQELPTLLQDQVDELATFLSGLGQAHPGCPLIVGGDFNINSIGMGEWSSQPEMGGGYAQLLAALRGVRADMEDVAYVQNEGVHPPTRPPTLAFPSYLNRMAATRFPQRHDYLFFSGAPLRSRSGAASGKGKGTAVVAPLTHKDLSSADCPPMVAGSYSITAFNVRLPRFAAPTQRPYNYLSDHFGISMSLGGVGIGDPVELAAAFTQGAPKRPYEGGRYSIQPALTDEHVRKQARARNAAAVRRAAMALSDMLATTDASGSVLSERTSWLLELTLFPVLISWLLVGVPWMRYVFAIGLVFLFVNRVLGQSRIRGIQDLQFATVSQAVISGKAPVGTRLDVPLSLVSAAATPGPIGGGFSSPWIAWSAVVEANPWRHALGYQCHRTGNPVWWTYRQVDEKVRALAAGLCRMGLAKGSVIGVLCDSNPLNVVVDLACMANGFTSLPLAGDAKVLRLFLDTHQVRYAICTKSNTARLLGSRSRWLTQVVQMQPIEMQDVSNAAEVSMQLTSLEDLCHPTNGSPPPSPGVDGPSELHPALSLISTEDEEGLSAAAAFPFTGEAMMRCVRDVSVSNLVKHHAKMEDDIYGMWSPYSHLFDRVMALAVLLAGQQLAIVDPHDERGMESLAPTVLVCQRTYLNSVESRMHHIRSRWTGVRSFIFRHVCRFRSRLLRHKLHDSFTLRYVFFRAISMRLLRRPPGAIHRLVVSSPSSTCPYRLRELVMLCVCPLIREVVFHPKVGVVVVDGSPIPGSYVLVDSLALTEGDIIPDNRSPPIPRRAPPSHDHVGELFIKPTSWEGDWQKPRLAAMWHPDNRLEVLGFVQELLWPLGGVCAVAPDIELLYKRESPVVNNIYVTCSPNSPLQAVVVPNRDVLEDMLGLGRLPNWTTFVREATPLVLQSLANTAIHHNLPAAHRIEMVHLHPFAFSQHDDFITPNGKLRRRRLAEYFMRYLNGAPSPISPTPASPTFVPGMQFPQSPSISTSDPPVIRTPFTGPEPECAMALDVGGTCAKITFFLPPNASPLPDFCEVDKIESTHALPRTTKFFATVPGGDESTIFDQHAGELRFVKLPSSKVPDMIDYLSRANVVAKYKPSALMTIPATGGGAQRFADLIQRKLGVSLTQVKEMDSVVAGVNFILRYAPELIFSYDIERQLRRPLTAPRPDDSQYPYLLVNVGSGVSLVKCTSSMGSYVRVGGSPIGGGTFWGLVRALTDIRSWDEVHEITRVDGPGDNTNVDLLVGDIYGFNAADLPALLSVDTVASTFGKLGTDRSFFGPNTRPAPSFEQELGDWDRDDAGGEPPELQRDPSSPSGEPPLLTPTTARLDGAHRRMTRRDTPDPGMLDGDARMRRASTPAAAGTEAPQPIDIVRSLLLMIANNVTQLAFLTSKSEGIKTVFFTGGFVRNNSLVQRQISRSMQYWSGGHLPAYFMEPDGYVGTIGSLQHSSQLRSAAAPAPPTKQ